MTDDLFDDIERHLSYEPPHVLMTSADLAQFGMVALTADQVAVVRAVLSSWLGMTADPAIPTKKPMEELC